MAIGFTAALDARKKRKIVWLSGLFFSLLLFLTLASNTLLTLHLPKVRTEQGREGALVTTWRGTARLIPRQHIDLSNRAEWSIKKVYVKEGDRVVKGQTLITYENPAAVQEILDVQAGLAGQRLTLVDLQDDYIEAVQNNDGMRARSTKREIERVRIAIGVQERKVTTMQSEANDRRRIIAPFDGVVTQVRATPQLPSGSGGPDVSVANRQQGYQFEIVIPDAFGRELRTGEKIRVHIEHEEANVPVEGSITDIRPMAGVDGGASLQEEAEWSASQTNSSQRVIVKVQHPNIQANELVSVELTQTKKSDGGMLVSNQAIRQAGKDSYVLIIEERSGPLGNIFIASKVSVRLGGTNGQETLVQGVYAKAQIIVESSEPVTDGQRVRI
ncbi:efflux RND transporter periplasmic adaptor subunit [Paenibacillus alvei]|uniref:Efflux RND transporter periplasmic adaptor subunit n=1 Tax=Paenibacillus alvei TaxID=44250 RepID=A0ABT4H294_PAEAL|nr:efflux RND transporter periplasmic adaptor subunit [Paenibacillus alvei]MCY7485996.1 efflux RND transporter periplasmic adaptor subunit [Paenibacillus alvei]MCY9542454.1 efflux RND transporter periplasmic adaptor subunit [Paenibacillus alvei]MCY9704306.1 efflux RND transporter periplasmic adaptor subunit [Paenibacillus alvei]MCY9738250.1 efflux RND transporter periplasmic adaptor subunit [Paenibacillus alvei]MCY9756529.1 efflux RND transporter periplasmic adaptor subunit [Paenibacillus alve